MEEFMEEKIRIIISGGGTGGHIFPAVSIANALKAQHPDIEILFVGAEGRMEMHRVPAAGYQIIGLPVAGFQAPCCSRCRRLCQWTNLKNGRNDGNPDIDSRTEFIRRCHQ